MGGNHREQGAGLADLYGATADLAATTSLTGWILMIASTDEDRSRRSRAKPCVAEREHHERDHHLLRRQVGPRSPIGRLPRHDADIKSAVMRL